MEKFVFLLKTYKDDLEYARRLVASFERFNIDGIKLFVVVDSVDYTIFEQALSGAANVTLLCKEIIDTQFADDISNKTGISNGYINQEIVKLSFWRLGLCKNYSCIDSELEFIRNFTVDEFMYDEDTPYTVLTEDHELETNPEYYSTYWVERQRKLDIIRDEFKIKNIHLMTCHGMQTFSSKVLEEMWSGYMQPKGLDYIDLLNISPYEFTWYNYYLQKEKNIEIIPCEPHFKTYHMAYQGTLDAISGVDVKSLCRGYCGIVINSNFSRNAEGSIDSDINWTINNYSTIKKVEKIVRKSKREMIKRKIKSVINHIHKNISIQ